MLNHTALLNKRKANWKHGGFDVNIEGQNSFELHGRSATLAGQPDLITQRDGQAVIVDVKNGQDSASHAVQVMIYLCAIPRALERYRTLKLRGQPPTSTTRSAYRRRLWTTSSYIAEDGATMTNEQPVIPILSVDWG